MNKITAKRYIALLAWACAAIYMVSYITRKNFAAITAEFIVAEGVTKSDASLVTVSLFICYGIGQLFSGWLGDHVPPKYVIFGGLCATGVCNLLVPLFGHSITALIVIWGLNGFAQAMLWPPMVRILADYLSAYNYQSACVKVSCGGSIGTILVYVIASMFIRVFGSWRTVFFFAAACAVIMAASWLVLAKKLERHAEKHGSPDTEEAPVAVNPDGSEKPAKVNLFAISPLFLIMLTIIFQGMLRDGVETWMPSYLHDIFSLDTSSAILTSVGMPIFTIISISATSEVFRRFFKNEMSCAATVFALGALTSLVLGIFHDDSMILSALLVTILSGLMHGVNMIQTALVARRYKKYGNVSFVSGLLNACTYIGSAIFTYGIAKLAELFDWQMTIFVWVIVAAIGTLFCLLSVKKWGQFKER